MDVSTLKSKIKTKSIPSFLIMTGSEWLVQKIYIQQIAKVNGLDLAYVDSVKDIYSKLKNRSFSAKCSCYVVRDDKDIITNEKLQSQIDNGLLGDNVLILLLTTVDKRTKFYKQYVDSIVEFEPLTDVILEKYIKKEIKLSTQNCQLLIDVCEHDYGRILLEIDKIKRYKLAGELMVTDDYQVLEDDCFQMLLKDGTIYKPPKDAIFDFVDAVLDRKIQLSFNLLQQCYDVGEATLVMLSVLYTNAKAVLQVQTCESKDVAKSTGLTGWQIKNATPHVGKYRPGELVDMMRLIQKLESGIKTGRIEEQVVMPYLLTYIL